MGWALGVRLGLGFGFGLIVDPITIQYFIAYNGITTLIDYRLQPEERLSYEK